jgi:hypothetical protein
MSKKWIAISFLLFAVAALLGWHLKNSIIQFNADNDPAMIQPVQDMKQMIAKDKNASRLAPAKNYMAEEFAIIPENNVFSESRSRGDEATEEVVQTEAPPLTEKPILVGINISNNQRTALLIDPRGSSADRNRRAEIKRIGDVFHGHTIAEIAPDHIVLKSGSRTETVPLHEGSKQDRPGKTPILSTRIVAFGSGDVSGGTPVAAAARTASAPRTRVPAATSRTNTVSKPNPEVPDAVQSIPPVPQTSPASQRARQVRSQQIPSAGSSDANRRVIRTPFGNIVRPVNE